MFFCEFCEFFNNNFFTEHYRTTASVGYQQPTVINEP